MLSIFAITSLSIFCNINFLSETTADWYLNNETIKVTLSKSTCNITEIILKGKNLISSPCSLAVSNGKQDNAGIIIEQYSDDSSPHDKKIYIRKEYSDKWIEQKFEINSTSVYWEANCEIKSAQDQEVRIDFIIPLAKSIDYLFTPNKNTPTILNNITAKRIIYRKDIFIPIITLYDTTYDIGISIIAPFEIAKPNLTFSIEQEKLIVSYRHLRFSKKKKAKVALLLVPHEGDWRPGLAFLLNKYPEYFYPAVENTRISEGWYYLSFPFKKENKIIELHDRNVKWIELHEYFPFYGLYVPESPEWDIIIDSDEVSMSSWEKGAGMKNSYKTMKNLINLWQKYGIGVYQYFQSFEAWHQYAEKYFADDIAQNGEGHPLPSWKFTNLMNPDPQNQWGKYIIGQAKEILEKYPGIDGIFYDRMDYKDYDFAHSDGLTMVDNKPAYMLGFAQERITEILFDFFHKNKKGIWGNGPTSIEVCKNLDGIMAEKSLRSLYKIQYLGLARPIIYLPYDSLPHDTEEKLKNALVCGAFPSTTYGGKECRILEEKYKPLFELIRSKKWVLTAKSLEIIPEHQSNIFRTPEGNYVIIVVNLNKSQLTPHPYEYNIPITINVPDAYSIQHGYILSGDWQGINSLAFRKTGSTISVVLPYHLSSSVLYLTKTSKHDVLRLSSPVFIKGTTEKIIFSINDVSEKSPSILEITTPWDRQRKEIASNIVEFQTFVPYDVNGEIDIKLRYKGKDYVFSNWALDKISLVPVEEIFVHLKEGEHIQFYCVNNLDKEVTFNLSGSFITGKGRIETPKKITLKPLEHKILSIFIKSEISGTVKLTTHIGQQKIFKSCNVETGLAFGDNDLFHDDFRHGMKNWTLEKGKWIVSNRTAQGSGQSHWAIVDNAEWSDYTFEVATRCKGSSNPIIDWLKSYIFFRVQDENNFYRFGIHGDAGVIDLYACVKGKWTRLSTAPFKPKEDKWYTLRIQVKGTKILGYIDGTKVVEVNDKTFFAGGIGIGVLEDAMKCEYKDIIVKEL